MFQKGRHSGAPAGLRRDKAFRTQLAKAYGVEKPPASFRQAMEKTYQSLPDELPVPSRPLRRFVRQAAAACAVLALAFCSLLGVNQAYPQLTEALPGLGPVFQAINGEKTPGPTPSPSPRPEFQPVVLPSKDHDGDLTVANAWTDGKTLFLDLEMDLPEEVQVLLQRQAEIPEELDVPPFYSETGYGEFNYQIWAGTPVMEDAAQWVENNASLRVNGLDMQGRWNLEFAPYEGKKTVKAQAAADLADIEVGQSVEIGLDLPNYCICAQGDPSQLVDAYAPGYSGRFTLEADRSRNLTVRASAQQNGVTLSALCYAPSRVAVDAELPFTGLLQDTLLTGFDSQLYGDKAPLGLFPELVDCSGQPVEYHMEKVEFLDSGVPLEAGSSSLGVRVHFASETNPQRVQGPFRLTFYELPAEDGYGNQVDALALRRVLAEFTFDPSTGRVYASEHFREEGREPLNITRDPASLTGVGLTDGIRVFHVGDLSFDAESPSGYSQRFSLQMPFCTQALTLYGYLEDQAVQALSFPLTFEGDGPEQGRGPEGSYFASWNMGEAGEDCFYLEMAMYLPEWLVAKYGAEPFERVELVDGESGKVLIPDLKAALAQSYRLGGNSEGVASE